MIQKKRIMKQSKFLNLNLHDAAKSAILAALTVFVSSLIQILDSGHLPNLEQLKTSALAALVAGLSYLLKNLLTNEENKFMKASVESPTSSTSPTTPTTTQPSTGSGGDRPPVPPVNP